MPVTLRRSKNMPKIGRGANTAVERHKPEAATNVEDFSVPKTRLYLLPGKVSHLFVYPHLDERGNPIPELDGKGNQKWNKNAPVYRTKSAMFRTAGGYPEKTICIYELDEKDPEYFAKLAVLEKERSDPANMIMDMDTYEKYRNPDAAEAKIENRKLRDAISEKDDIIAKLKKENDDYKALLDGATKDNG
jgi:hypothetical protein